MILGIDPGCAETAFCLVDDDHGMKPLEFMKVENKEALRHIYAMCCTKSPLLVAIEHIESYGMPVGREVFETAEMIGRIKQAIEEYVTVIPIYRHEEKQYICHSQKANDSTIRHALIQKYARSEKNNGKGSKKDPDFFYGFAADVWSAFAVAETANEKWKEEHHVQNNS